ncbi:MAG: LpqB family beta-propeller domain-containing protein [Chloroflexota bacterium]
MREYVTVVSSIRLWYRPAPMLLIGRFLAGALAAIALLASSMLGGWTPIRDGGQAFQTGRGQPSGRILYVRDGNIWLWQSGVTRQLTTGETWRQPAWSPDGTAIAYVYRGQNFSDIFVMKDDGTENRRLTRGQARVLDDNDWVFRPAWTPDGTQISFVADSGTPFLQPGTMNTEGGARRLLSLGGVFEMVDSVAWSPDGKRLAVTGFKRSPSGQPLASQIFLWESGKVAQPFTENQNGAFDPTWSPDGEWLAYAARNGSRSNVYVRSTVDGDEVQLSKLDLARGPAWSPDGKSIAFLSGQRGSFELMVVDVTTSSGQVTVSNERTLIADASADAASGISWGP